MRVGDVGRLVALGAIWGASFLFMRIAVPVLGPLATADLRTLIAGGALAAYFAVIGFDPQWRRFLRHHVIAGVLTTALPFACYAYAALSLTAGLMAVLNATAPLWGALWSAVLLGERLTLQRIAGLAIGAAGVALVTQPDPQSELAPLAVAAALAATFCYGLAGAYIRRWASEVPSRSMAVGTQVAAGVLLLPFAVLVPPAAAPGALVAASVLALGLLCGAIAYLLYFRLLADIGATGALTVAFLIPVFGVLWGVLFLGETLTETMLAGAALILAGTVLVLRS